MNFRTNRYRARVTDALGIGRDEVFTDDRDEADRVCRMAIEDGCRKAEVALLGGIVVSTWNPEELRIWKQFHPE